nr:MAG TPA: hypothetical protein [Caudoviricetes sp.]
MGGHSYFLTRKLKNTTSIFLTVTILFDMLIALL